MSWLNLHRKPFLLDDDKYYNLGTERRVTKIPERMGGLRSVRVLGTESELIDFWTINKERFVGLKFDDEYYHAGSDLKTIVAQEFCKLGTAGSILNIPNTTDVSDLTTDQLNSLCTFSFAGCFLKGKVMEVIDGDTLDVVVYLPILSLGLTRKNKSSALIPQQQDTGFFTRLRVRLFGIDTPEIDTEDGKLARELFETRLKAINNVVWLEFLKEDKYGRSLAVLYEQEDKSRMLNDYLIHLSEGVNKKLANIYQGGKKSLF